MVEKCCFDISFRSCACLTHKSCSGCKFKKTRAEFEEDRRKAAELLQSKGLEPYLFGKIMTTRQIKIKNEYNRIFTKDTKGTKEIGENET